jgi:hypothetical protein
LGAATTAPTTEVATTTAAGVSATAATTAEIGRLGSRFRAEQEGEGEN